MNTTSSFPRTIERSWRHLFALALSLSACAGQPPTKAALATTPPEPTNLKVLGAVYTVPEYLKLESIESAPGFAKLKYEDGLTGCTGFLFFNTVANKDQHDAYVQTNFDEGGVEKSLSSQNILFKRSESEIPVLGAQARLVSWTYIESEREVQSGLYDLFVAEQNLSFAGLHDCPLGLLEKESQIVTSSLESQKTF